METLKLTKIAKQLGIKHSAICQWKQKNKIPADRIFQIATILNIDPFALYNNNDLFFSKLNNTTKKKSVKELRTDKKCEAK